MEVGQKHAGDAEEILKAEERAERAEQRGQEEADREKQDGDAMLILLEVGSLALSSIQRPID